MNHVKTLVLFTIFLTISLATYPQEVRDSLDTNTDYRPVYETIPLIMEMTISDFYPLSGKQNVGEVMSSQFLNYENSDLDWYRFYASPDNAFYSYSNNGYSFWQNSRPMHLGASWHLGETLGWEKFDLFMDASGLMVTEYQDINPMAPSTGQNAFMWEVGAGAGYKLNDKSTIFIRGSVGFRNLNPIGEKGIGGMHMQF